MNTRRVTMVVYNDLRHDARVFKEASTLRDAGYGVHVVAMTTPGTAPFGGWPGISVEEIDVGAERSLRVRYARFWRRARRAVEASTPDAVHAHDLDAFIPAVRAARKLDVPLVYDAHELWTELPSLVERPAVRWVWRMIERHYLPRADAMLTVSDGVAREFERRYGARPVVVRNLPSSLGDVAPLPLRDTLDLPGNAPIVLHQGTLGVGYGIEKMIAAVELLPEACLVLIGGGPLAEVVRHLASASPAASRIRVLDAVPFQELPAYTRAADVGLVLGESTGLNAQLALPNKMFEYFAARVPAVGVDWPDMGAVFRQYNAGVLVPPGSSPETVAEAIRTVLADRARYVAGCVRAAAELVWDREAPKLVELYADLPWKQR